MKPGVMKQRITLQEYSEVADGGGGVTKTWTNLASTPTVWASISTQSGRSQSGREVMEEGRVNATALTAFTIRNRSDINETCRIVWNGENYNIRQIRRLGTQPLYVEIIAERGVSN